MIITETEEIEAEPVMTGIPDKIETVEETPGAFVGETVEETPGAFVGETVEETPGAFVGETVEETPGAFVGETVEETPEVSARKTVKAASGKIREVRAKPQNPFEVAAQKSHIKRMCEWLLPYMIVTILIIGVGGAVVLTSNSRTRQLRQRLQEQYGEYFADE